MANDAAGFHMIASNWNRYEHNVLEQNLGVVFFNGSHDNVVGDNTASGNRGDGFGVFAGSSNNRFAANTARANVGYNIIASNG